MTHIVPHYMSYHREEIYKNNKETCNAAFKKGSPLLFLLRGKERVFGCLGCSKFYMSETKMKNHFETCPNKQQHKEKAGTLLPQETTKDASTQTDPSI